MQSEGMIRLALLLIGFICLLGSGYLWLTVDPWKRASLKGSADAAALFNVRNQPDRVGFLLSQDPALLKAVVWSPTGMVLYPGPRTYSPTRFQLSFEELEDLTKLTSQDFEIRWSPYDRDGTVLLYCQPTPRICLLYDRDALQSAVPIPLTGVSWGMIGALSAMGLLSFLLFWRRGPIVRSHDQLVLLPEQHSARRGTLEVALTPRDFRLLEFLQTKQGKVVTKDELYDAGWGRNFMPNSRALDQHIINLRKKLDPDKSRSPVIETVRGVGYRLLK